MISLTRYRALSPIPHAITSRAGGISEGPFASLNLGFSTADSEENVAANRQTLLHELGINPARVSSGWLTHGSDVAEFHAGRDGEWPLLHRLVREGSSRVEGMFRSDAVVSDVPGLHFMITFADCVPILLADVRRGVVGAVHAGWRGTAAGVAAAAVRVMVASFGCDVGNIAAVIGPSIGPCCYTVGAEVPAVFERNGQTPVLFGRNGSRSLDLWESNRRQLTGAGVRPNAIEVAGQCTSCHAATYFSHRASGGTTGRFAAVIGLANTAR
jgi:YfiH family protein